VAEIEIRPAVELPQRVIPYLHQGGEGLISKERPRFGFTFRKSELFLGLDYVS
jgi:hypothetical protein